MAALAAFVAAAYGREEVSHFGLGGDEWRVTNSNRSIAIGAMVPGQIHLDLLRARLISPPYFRDNDVKLRWVAMETWTYSRSFHVPAELAAAGSVVLRCEGLDTVASATLNGRWLGNSSNMFLPFEVDVTASLVRDGLNELSITFGSAPSYAAERAAAYPYPVPHATFPSGMDNANFIRKRPSDFGWDWGPAFATQGIWKPIHLVGFHLARIISTSAEVVLQRTSSHVSYPGAPPPQMWPPAVPLRHDDTFELTVSTVVQCGAPFIGVTQHTVANVTFNAPVECSCATARASDRCLESADIVIWANRSFLVGTVDLWWPADYGKQTLYNLTTTLISSTTTGTLDIASRRIGFRSVRVVTDPLPSGEEGESFYFEVNGQPLFAKGASIVPFDAFESRPTDEYERHMLLAALEANFNSVRRWGGGDYGRDSFWDAADELGVLVWQDFQFASALYPRDSEFVHSVEAEVQYQVRRLTGHPSLIVWCGSNEAVIGTNRSANPQVEPIHEILMQQYTADLAILFDQSVRQALHRVSPSANFYASSPSNGALVDEPERGLYIHRFGYAFDPRWGDVRHYDFAGDCSDWETYPQGRLVSEYGIQSYPSLHTLRHVTEPNDWNANSAIMLHRQHKPNGNAHINDRIVRYFDLPIDSNQTARFEHYIYLSQAAQALCVAAQSKYYRTLQHRPGAFTMGAFYWQLNDVWQGPTWSSLEYGAESAAPRWKLLHYHMKEAFAPLMVTALVNVNDTRVEVRYVLDRSVQLDSAELTVEGWSFAGKLLSRQTIMLRPTAGSSGVVANMTLSTIMGGEGRNDGVSRFTLIGGNMTSVHVVYPRSFHGVTLRQPNFTVTEQHCGYPVATRLVCLVVVSNAVAPWVEFSTAADGFFSSNGVLLLPFQNFQVNFTSTAGRAPDNLARDITIRSIAR